jgi:hypothetical protein
MHHWVTGLPSRAPGSRRALRCTHTGHRHGRPDPGWTPFGAGGRGRWAGWLEVDGVRHPWTAAYGNRDRSWGPRRWGGPKMWRWFSINLGEEMHAGGIRLGTDAGDLHRGWVWDGARATSIAEWRLRTEVADDGVTHEVVHLQVVDKETRAYDLRGDVLRVADIGRPGGTVVNEGLTRWTYRVPGGGELTGYGISEYLHQLDGSGRPVVDVD